MALNPTVLSASIRVALLANPASAAADNPALTALCDAIAISVVTHLKTAGMLTVVTACPAGAGTGTGTIG